MRSVIGLPFGIPKNLFLLTAALARSRLARFSPRPMPPKPLAAPDSGPTNPPTARGSVTRSFSVFLLFCDPFGLEECMFKRISYVATLVVLLAALPLYAQLVP